jgi:hypothetical protein
MKECTFKPEINCQNNQNISKINKYQRKSFEINE